MSTNFSDTDHGSASSSDGPEPIGKFEKTSFVSFLHYILGLVYAVPKRNIPPTNDEINKELEICLKVIVEAIKDVRNESLMDTINEALAGYRWKHNKTHPRAALVKATNAALILLQPLAIGNSKIAVNADSDDFPMFATQKHAVNWDQHMPNIFCATRKHIVDVCPKETECLLASGSENKRFLEWKHYYSCWEFAQIPNAVNILQPIEHAQGYASPLKEYRNTSTGTNPLCAEYASRVFDDTFGRDHILNVAINDEFLSVWYFDHESAINTSAFNFLEDFSYYLLFLFALQRFSAADWGHIDQLLPANSNSIQSINLSDLFRSSGGEATFQRLRSDHVHHYLSLRGRTPHIIFGRIVIDGKATSAMLKLSWRQRVRTPEGTFLEEARKRLQNQNYSDACDCLPTLLAHKDFSQFSTHFIRQRLMITVKNDGTKMPYLIVLPQYEPLTVKTKDWTAFFKHYMALIYCHLSLWSVGIEHGDINEANLMWDARTKKPILCGFDFAHFFNDEQIEFTETGTSMFMALDLLGTDAMEGRVKHLYRHDLESFAVVLVWIMLSHYNGVFIGNKDLERWNTTNAVRCMIARRETYNDLSSMDCPGNIPPDIWDIATEAVFMSQKISGEHRCLLVDLYKYNDPRLPDYIRQRHSLSAAAQKRLEQLGSVDIILDFVSILATFASYGVPCSNFLQSIIHKIKTIVSSNLCG